MVCASMVGNEGAGVADSFDVDSAIAGFQADSNRASLELPRLLSADQRKHAKKVVEEYPDLKCESFGMGKDRRLHLFKCNLAEVCIHEESSLESTPHRVSVKNTFIDDWVHGDDVSPDARIVQSMPHNMFGQCLSAELRGRTEAEGEDTTTAAVTSTEAEATSGAPPTVDEDQFFALGADVVIHGLVKAPGFNGASGVVQSWDAESGRYNVLLTGQRWAKIKGENLLHAQPR